MASYNTSANVVLTLNGKQADNIMASLGRKAEALRKKIDQAASAGDKATMQKLQRELNSTKRVMDQLQGSALKVDDVLRRLDSATPKELNKALRQLKRELNGLERGTQAWDAHVRKIKAVRAEMDKVNASLREQQSGWQRFNGWLNQCQTAILGLGAGLTGLTMAGRKAVQTYADMDQEMANVRKFTGLSAEQVEALNEEFKNMDTRTSREELNQLAQQAGRLGKTAPEDILGFVRAADQVNVALDDLGDDATLTLSKLTGVFGDEKRLGTEKALLSVGSVINELSQNCAASAPYLAEFASRMGGVASQAGMTVQQVMAFGAVLDSNNQPIEASSTALSQIIVRLYQEPAKYAKVAGLDVQKFTNLVRTDMNAALIELMSTLQKTGGMDRLAPMFADMDENGSRAVATLSTLAGHIEEVKSQQQVANQAFEEATSITKEFDVQNNTVQAGLDKAKKHVTELAVELGQKLMPVVGLVMSSTTIFLQVLSATVDFVAKYKYQLIALGTAYVSYTAIIHAATIKVKLHNAWLATTKATHAALNAVVGAGKIVWAAMNVVVGLFTGGIKGASNAMKALNATIKANPMGLLISLVTTAISVVTMFTSKTKEATEEQKAQAKAEAEAAAARKKEHEEWKASLTDIGQKSADFCKEELTRLDMLYKAATDEAKSKDERRRAAQRLQELYPDYFRNMSLEQIMVGEAATAYGNLREKILEAARAKALMAKIEENQGQLIDLEIEEKTLRKKAEDRRKEAEELKKATQPAAQPRSDIGVFVKTGQMNNTSKGTNLTEDLRKRVTYAEQDQTSPKTIRISKLDSFWAESQAGLAESRLNDNLKKQADVKEAINNLADMQEQGGSAIPQDSSGYVSQKQLKKQQREEERERKKRLAEQRRQEAAERRAKAKEKKEFKDSLDNAKGEWERGQAENEIEMTSGIKGWSEYLQDKYDLQQKYYDDCMALYEKAGLSEDEDYQALLKKKAEHNAKWLEEKAKLDEDEYRRRQFMEEAEAKADFHTPDSALFRNEEALQQRLFEIKVKYLGLTKDIYIETSEKYHDYTVKLEQAQSDERIRRMEMLDRRVEEWRKKYQYQEASDRMKMELELLEEAWKMKLLTEKEHEQALKDIREKYRDEFLPGSAKGNDDDIKLKERMKRDLETVEALYKQGILDKEEYEKAKEAIRKKYEEAGTEKTRGWGSQQTNQLLDIYEAWKKFFNATEEDGSNWATRLANLASSVFAVMSAGLQQYSEYVKASGDIEIARAEKKYERIRSLAEGNSYKVAQAEKEKENEIARIKNEVSRKQYAMQITQAIASTATNALMAYGSAQSLPYPMSLIIGTMAAALATAQGMAQIAVIKKQAQASEAQGYAEGGFTRPGRKQEPAGIVHAGEWVAPQALVESPVTRPLIDALEQARLGNTVPAIRAQDVSRTITAPVRLASALENVAAPSHAVSRVSGSPVPSDRDLQRTMRRLADRLDRPFVTVNAVTGEAGMHKAQRDYERLMANKSPRRRKSQNQ